MMYIVMVVLMFGVFLTFVNIWELRRMQSEHMTLQHSVPEADTGAPTEDNKKPIVWVNGKNVSTCNMHMVIVRVRSCCDILESALWLGIY